MFRDRKDAGIRLTERLRQYADQEGVLVLALPRGGVTVGLEIATALHAPLDVLIVRKVGFPWQPELAAGAVSETGTIVLNQSLIATGNVSKEYLDAEVARQREELDRRVGLYRGGRPIAALAGKTVLLVDDGIATGATVKAAVQTLRKEGIRKLVVAVPVAPPTSAAELTAMADEFVCLATPEDFMAVGSFYRDFTQVTDEEVVAMLRQAAGTEKKAAVH
jgi:predicted phosphoribosyltransferase